MTTRRQTGTLVSSFSEVMWPGPTTLKTMDSGKLLWATGDSHLRREKRKKSSDDATTNEDLGAYVLRGDVAWTDNVKNDEQRKTAVSIWRQSPEAKKTKKPSDDAAINDDLHECGCHATRSNCAQPKP